MTYYLSNKVSYKNHILSLGYRAAKINQRGGLSKGRGGKNF